MKTFTFFLCLVFFICCNTHYAGGKPLVLKRMACIDPGFQREAFSILVPEGWDMESQIEFGTVPALPYDLAVSERNGDGTLGVDIVHRGRGYHWASPSAGMLGDMLRSMQGQDYYGNLVHPVMAPDDYFYNYVHPYLTGKFPEFSMSEIKHSQEIIESVMQSASKDPSLMALINGGMVQVSYDAITVEFVCNMHGKTVEGHWAGVFSYRTDNRGNIIWNMSDSFTFFAPVGTMKSHEHLFSLITRSICFDPTWVGNIKHTRAKMANDHRALHDFIADANMELYGSRQASQDAMFQKFSDAILETTDYTNPFSGEQQRISNMYKNVWINTQGDVILTDESLNPNADKAFNSQEWRKASK